MKKIILILLVFATGYVHAQTCPFDTVTYNSSTVSIGIIPAGNTIAQVIYAGSGDSSYLSTFPDSTTSLIASAPSASIGNAEIVLRNNFRTNVGETGTFSAYIQGCSDSTDSAALRPASVIGSRTDFAYASRLQVYPTMSTGLVTVAGNPTSLGNADILVVDESGHTVYHIHNGANTTVNLHLGSLSNGLYFIRVNNGSGAVLTQRIIINK
jgi:type IX secretion system substrate protein